MRQKNSRDICVPLVTGAMLLASLGLLAGCQDGPLYAIKAANPYFSMYEWKEDEKLGVTDHERRKQLTTLVGSIGSMSDKEQDFWSLHLDRILENDENAEMRRLAIQAASKLRGERSLAMIEKGLDDESLKVRMEACRMLGTRKDEAATRLLASTVGTETDQDVRNAAIKALGNHNSPVAINSLRLALSNRDPATQNLAIDSLKGATGKNYGSDPEVWIAALEGKPATEKTESIAERARKLF